MRRYHKKLMFEIITEMNVLQEKLTIENVSEEIRKDICTKLQETAIFCRNLLEQEPENIASGVTEWETYCKQIWQYNQERKRQKRTEYFAQLTKQLELLEQAAIQIREKIDIVFMPYKASMWDCMETVWQAADEDPDCHAYVIPIPYYDINPDGSAGQMHYEGEQFPSYVPITSFQKYDITKEHPEVIYIHNPYDNYNRVTSVHPSFYSAELKKNTDTLAYIPYFMIMNGHLPATHRLLPAYQNADFIILQSETMVEEIDDSIPRERLLVLGSPKAERMIRIQNERESLKPPEDWYALCKGKKVVFYNTSLTNLLKEREKALDKMEEVINLVSENKDMVLLWRPHPLYEATLNSMCPELVERYRALVQRFQKERIGIYDTTADVDQSVALADCYIGDQQSSVVDLFALVNKPRFYMTEKCYAQVSMDEICSERTFDVCKIGDNLWFVTKELQLLCKYNIIQKQIEIVAEVPEISNTVGLHYVNIVHYENQIILVPYSADALCIYNMKSKQFSKQYFKQEYVQNCFGRAIPYGKYLYLTPMDYPAVVRYDMETGEFVYYYDCITDMLRTIEIEGNASPFVWGVSVYESELYIASMWSNHILTFSMDTQEYRISRVGAESNHYRGMVSDKDWSYLITCDNPKIVRWNRNDGSVKEYTDYPIDFVAGQIPFKNIIKMGDTIYVIPFHANHACMLKENSEAITYTDILWLYQEDSFASAFYQREGLFYDFAKKISDSEMIAMSRYNDSLLFIDVAKHSSTMVPLRIPNALFYECRKMYKSLLIISESERYPLDKYLEMVRQELLRVNVRKGLPCIKPDADEIGMRIHQTVIKK